VSNEKFKVFPGKYYCQECKEEVLSVRLWGEEAKFTWMCSKKHISRVAVTKTKRDYEREK